MTQGDGSIVLTTFMTGDKETRGRFYDTRGRFCCVLRSLAFVLGRTTSITTGAGTENITYDDAGRISVKSLPSQGTEKRYSYYKNGLLKSVLTYRNGELTNTENSEYDLSGNKTLEETDGNIKRYA